MRFRKWPRLSAYEDTIRKRAALVRGQRLQREKLPLLAELIADQQPGIDEEMACRAEWWSKTQQADRDWRARKWREARARLASHDAPPRHVLIALWRECPYPADPSYLLDLLHGIDKGRIDPFRPPWKHPKPLNPRITANPARFGEAFRKIGERKTAGGAETAPPDELIFIGNLGSGLIFLTCRVRPADPHEPRKIRASHPPHHTTDAGGAGDWVDMEVNGPCPDGDLALIQRLAQDANTRPVVTRRTGAAASLRKSPPPAAPPRCRSG